MARAAKGSVRRLFVVLDKPVEAVIAKFKSFKPDVEIKSGKKIKKFFDFQKT